MTQLKLNIRTVYFFPLAITLLLVLKMPHSAIGQGSNTPPVTTVPNNRLTHYNTIGWFNYFGTIRLNGQWGLHTEYQFRRNDLVTEWQQGLLRLGVNFQLQPNILLRAGYAWIETYPYGDVPINALGRDFTEHRLFQMAQLSQKEGRFSIQHRFMLEQRFVGRYSSALESKEDEFPLLHRARYMIRLQTPFKGQTIKNKTAYAAVYNEIMIGFGRNVNANIFDQNRIGVLVGYRLNEKLRIEAGYLNQTLQFGRLINGQNIFQSNNGIIINMNVDIDWSR